MATTSFNYADIVGSITVVGYIETTNGYGGNIQANSRLMFRVTGGRTVRFAMKSGGNVVTVTASIDGGAEADIGSTTSGFAREVLTLDPTTTLGSRDYSVGFAAGTGVGYFDLSATIEVDTDEGDPAPTIGLISGLVPAVSLRSLPGYVQVLGRFASYAGWSHFFTNGEGSLRVVGKLSSFKLWIDCGLQNSVELYEGVPGEKFIPITRVFDAGTGEGDGNSRGKFITINTSGVPSEDKVYHLILPKVVGSVLIYGDVNTTTLTVPPTWIFAVDSISLAASATDESIGETRPMPGDGHGRRLCALYDRNYYCDGVPFRKLIDCSGSAYTAISNVEAFFPLAGTNDNGGSVPVETFQAAAISYLADFIADKPDAKVFVMGSPDSGAAPLSAYNGAWQAAIAASASPNVYDVIVEGAFAPYGVSNPNFRSDDNIHPIRFGYTNLMAEVTPTLDEVFLSPPAPSGNARGNRLILGLGLGLEYGNGMSGSGETPDPEPEITTALVADAGSISVNGEYELDGAQGGKNKYSLNETIFIYWNDLDLAWTIRADDVDMYTSVEDVEFPWECAIWIPVLGGIPAPTVTGI